MKPRTFGFTYFRPHFTLSHVSAFFMSTSTSAPLDVDVVNNMTCLKAANKKRSSRGVTRRAVCLRGVPRNGKALAVTRVHTERTSCSTALPDKQQELLFLSFRMEAAPQARELSHEHYASTRGTPYLRRQPARDAAVKLILLLLLLLLGLVQ